MRVKLNGKGIDIIAASQLSIIQYRELMEIAVKKNLTTIDYLCVVTKHEFAEIARLSIDDHTKRRLDAYIGIITPLLEFEKNKSNMFLFAPKNRVYLRSNVDTCTLGVRELMQIRSETEKNYINLACYLLAIVVTENYDAEEIEINYNKILELNHDEVLSFISFFLRNFLITSIGETKK